MRKRNLVLPKPGLHAPKASVDADGDGTEGAPESVPLEFVGEALLKMNQNNDAYGNVIHGCMYLDREFSRDTMLQVLKERWVTAHPRVRSRLVRKGKRYHLQVVPMKDIDWDYHLRVAQLPATATRDDLHEYIGQLVPQTMDLERPLWQFVVVERMDDDGCRAAIIPRIHHILGDGTSLIHLLLTHLIDAPKVTATPRTRASSNKKKRRQDVGVLAPVRALARRVTLMARGVFNGLFIAVLPPDTPTVFKAKTTLETGGPRKLTVAQPVPLSKLKQIKNALGGTVNDVLVSLVTGAFRRYLLAHGNAQQANSLSTKFRCALPINTRPRGADITKTLGNEFVLLSMAMPIHIADPLVRLVEVKRLCDNMKVSPETPVTALLNQLALSVLPTSAYVDTTMTLFNKFTFMFTNVIGPPDIVSVGGVDAIDMAFWVPTPVGNIACLLSYNGTCNLSVCAVPKLMPDTHGRLVDFFNEDMDELYRLAVQEKRPIPLAKCGRREGLEFAFTIALAASILLWSFWVINFAMALLG